MTRHPLWLRRFCSLLIALFDLTEIRPGRCDCEAYCRKIRKAQEAKRTEHARSGTTPTGEMNE